MNERSRVKRTEVMPVYKVWSSIIQRCTNPRNAKYQDYGGRGITVCERWRDFDHFYKDVGPKPFQGAQIDRIDNDKGYLPGNVRWATRQENQRNRRANHTLTCKGVTRCIQEWSEVTGIKPNTILTRIRRGWRPEQALEIERREPLNRLSEAEKKRRTRACQECGSDFIPRPTQVREGGGKYCSNKCSLKAGLRARWARVKA